MRDSAASAGPAQRPAARLGRWRGPCGAPAGRQALGPTRARAGMRRSAGPGLALSLLLALLGRGGAFYLEVRELEEKCFIQEIPDGTVVIGARARPVRALPSLERKGDGAARTQLRPAPTLPCPGWAPGKWVDRGLTKASLPLRVRAPGGKSGQDPDGRRRSWEGRRAGGQEGCGQVPRCDAGTSLFLPRPQRLREALGGPLVVGVDGDASRLPFFFHSDCASLQSHHSSTCWPIFVFFGKCDSCDLAIFRLSHYLFFYL